MNNSEINSKVNIIKSLFKCREDVFALRWEKDGKAGYMPACHFDPYMYRAHKMKGGTFQNYTDKTNLPLTNEQIAKHLNGDHFIGIYPLIKNDSFFIAADFDEANWVDECKIFMQACEHIGIPAYLERSRSGKGGHVWIFFEEAYPSLKSRKIIITLLEKTGIVSRFDKNSSFDRLFPNQDFLSGKGFGNLIALPFHKKSMEQNNSCFLDINTMEPYPDQWKFLENINRVSVSRLDEIFDSLPENEIKNAKNSNDIVPNIISGNLAIRLNSSICINRNAIPSALINFLKDELNFLNSEYIIKKKAGRNVYETQLYFKFVEENENDVIIPRGFMKRLLVFCRENKIEHEFIDERKKLDAINFSCKVQLREHQTQAIEAASKKNLGVIVAPPGSGKTIIALKIIAAKEQPALIIVHRKQLAEQWIERIQTFLSIPKNEIGIIGQGKSKIGKQITVSTIQSLQKELNKADSSVQEAFGTIIVDECHHVPAETFRTTLSKLNTFYMYGLTATPFRKYNDGKLIFIHLGEIICEIKPEHLSDYKIAKIVIRDTELDVPFNSKTDKFETLSKILVHDSSRNKLILKDITAELNSGKKVVIITERKEHIDALYQYLKQSYEAVTLSGEDSEASRSVKWKILKEGNYQAIITTGQFFGEGTDLQNVQCLFLVYPFSFEGKLIQYIGRVQRSELTPVIYDYRDIKIDYLNKLFLKRNVYYRKLDQLPSLFDDPKDESPQKITDSVTIEQKIKVPIDQLDFRYGAIAFRHLVSQMNTDLEFEIENSDMRPEFDVLKPYFEKVLKSKNAEINIHAGFQYGKLISQLALSADLEKINRELIESVRFRFVSKNIIGRGFSPNAENLLDINQLQADGGNTGKLYNSGEELLEDILRNKDAKHYRHLRYLADKHEGSILKIRFVLNPFSFVFLLSGNEQFHIVLETLDTEEATYIWHLSNNKSLLPEKLRQIDQDLNIIRNKGRQVFLENLPENFSRIYHDYSDERKGFIIWKDLLEEKLV